MDSVKELNSSNSSLTNQENLNSQQFLDYKTKIRELIHKREMYFLSLQKNANPQIRIKPTSASAVDCEPNLSEFDGCIGPTNYGHYVEDLPGYGDCRAYVTYEMYVCTKTTATQVITSFVFNKFTAVPEPGTDCASLLAGWRNLAMTNQLSQLKIEMDAFLSIVRQKLEADWLLLVVDENKTIYDCEDPDADLLTASFYQSHCYRYCINTTGGFNFYQSACSEVCCQTTTKYCWDEIEEEFVIVVIDIDESSECEDVVVACNTGYTSAGDCFHNCVP